MRYFGSFIFTYLDVRERYFGRQLEPQQHS